MQNRNGYVLIGLLLFFSVLALSGSVAVLEQDTRLKRFTENEAKGNVDSLRRAIDLYKYKYTNTADADPVKIASLNESLKLNRVDDVIASLTAERFLRSRIATGTMKWRIIENKIKNSSFEEDLGGNPGDFMVDTWQGNFNKDGVPDWWEYLDQGGGMEQYIKIDDPISFPATFVASFWVRGTTSTAGTKVRVRDSLDNIIFEMQAGSTAWKRYFGSFLINAAQTIKFQVLENGTTSGDKTYVDGLMLEYWKPPTGFPATMTPLPSAWVDGRTLVPDVASQVVQQGLLESVIGSDTSPASLSYWLEW